MAIEAGSKISAQEVLNTFVEKAGDTMVGDLFIEKSGPGLRLVHTGTTSSALLQNGGTGAVLYEMNSSENSDNYRALGIYNSNNSSSDLKKAIRVLDKIDGTTTTYYLYGTHNKPTLSEIGAAPAYTYGTSDLTAGTSSLATGTLYLVYE